MENGIIKHILVCALLITATCLSAAAKYEVKATPLEANPKDFTAVNTKHVDQNGQRCALIKFETPLVRDIKFSAGKIGVEQTDIKEEDDEIWVWISADVTSLTIKCSGATTLKRFATPDLKPGKVYSSKITTGLPKETSAIQYVNFYCESVPFAVSIDGKAPVISNEKRYADSVTIGTHDVLIQSRCYRDYRSEFRVLRSKAYNDTIRLVPNYGEFMINPSQGECTIQIDGEEYPAMQNIKMEPGMHNIVVTKERYERYEQNLEIHLGETVEVQVNLIPAFAIFTIQAAEEETEIWVDDQYRGHSPQDIELTWGVHKIEGRRSGYDTWELPYHDFNSKTNHRINIPVLARQYGSVRFSFLPADARVRIDGVEVLTENGAFTDFRMPTGPHLLQISRSDYRSFRDTFHVKIGELFVDEYELRHDPKGDVNISTEDSIGIYRWDEETKTWEWRGLGNFMGKLPVGRNLIMLANNDSITCKYNTFVVEGSNNPSVKFPFTRKLLIRTNLFGRPNVRIENSYESRDIDANKKEKVLPMSYKMYISHKGYETLVDSIDFGSPHVAKKVYRAQLYREKDTLHTKKAPIKTTSKVRQGFYDNAGTWFFGIVDFGYTFDFSADSANCYKPENGITPKVGHMVHIGVLPFRYKMLGVSLFDFGVNVAADNSYETFCYLPKLSLVVPCSDGFAFTFYGGASINMYDAFIASAPADGSKRRVRTDGIAGLSMLLNGAGKVPVSIFGEYKLPLSAAAKEELAGKWGTGDEAKYHTFRVGINMAIGIDR